MSDSKKTAWNGSRISRRRMLSYGLAGMAGVVGGICPASAFGDTNIMHGTKTGGRSGDRFVNSIRIRPVGEGERHE
jgi:hypothetical protein